MLEGKQTKLTVAVNNYLSKISDENKKYILEIYNYLIISKKSNKDKNYYDHDMKMLKLILNLRIKSIDNLIS